MSMTLSGGAPRQGRRRRRGLSAALVSEINVTPLVDVMLVLLIVFMVAAPLLTAGVPIDLPETAATAMQPDRKPVMIAISSEGGIFVGEDPVTEEGLLSAVANLAADGTGERIYLRGDTAAQYGAVMKVMGALSGAGYAQIGLITRQNQSE